MEKEIFEKVSAAIGAGGLELFGLYRDSSSSISTPTISLTQAWIKTYWGDGIRVDTQADLQDLPQVAKLLLLVKRSSKPGEHKDETQ